MYASSNQYVPQCVTDRRPLVTWMLLVGGTLVFVGLLFAAPLAQVNEWRWLSLAVYRAFGHVCHQIPERSFYIVGYPLAVCARCTGLYVGFAGVLVSYPLLTSLRRTHTPERKWLFIAAAPLGIDFALDLVDIWRNTHTSRFLTGAFLGAISVLFILPGFVQLSMYQSILGPRRGKQSDPRGLPSTVPSKEIVAAPSDYSAPLRRI
jgi:uncharacterized membrane protein